MINNEEKRQKGRKDYYTELKENASFLIGLGGWIVAITVFHYSVYLIRKTEYYNVNADLLNESILTDGIRAFLQLIIVLICMVSLLLIATYVPRKKLSKRNIELLDNRMGTRGFGLLFAFLLSICVIVMISLYDGYTNDLPNTKESFAVLAFMIGVHVVVVSINYKLSFRNVGTKTLADVPVMMQLIYICIMLVFYLFPFYYVENLVKTEDVILVTSDNKYMVVEKNPNDILLRVMKQSKENDYTYYLTDDYIQKDAKKVVYKSRKIDSSVNYEKEGYLLFKVNE